MAINLEEVKTKIKYTFSGHDSFPCRHFWPKKGYDYIKSGKSFNDEDAVVKLGVGKNMVSAIRYWMRAMNLLTVNDTPTPFADKLLADNGWDPYLEDEASLWLLHYHLVKNGLASSYYLMFNEFRKEKIEFTKNNFVNYLKRKTSSNSAFQLNENTVGQDFEVLIKMYLQPDHSKDKEDIFSGLFTDLNLLKGYGKKGSEVFMIENTERVEIPHEVIFYTVLDQGGFETSINLLKIEQEPNYAGSIFAINRTGLFHKIGKISQKNPDITFNDHAGIKELQFKKKPDALTVLDTYYAN
jgi:hypothetical protein